MSKQVRPLQAATLRDKTGLQDVFGDVTLCCAGGGYFTEFSAASIAWAKAQRSSSPSILETLGLSPE